MSQSQIDQLKSTIEALGLVEGEDYSITGGGSGSGNSISFSISLELDPRELPEVLKPYAMSEASADRAIYKGSEKRTIQGVIFADALSSYAHDRLRREPETVALEATLDSMTVMEEFREYEAKRRAVWDRLWSDPELIALQKDLDENYL